MQQIFSKLGTTIEETPFIICTSHPTEYLSDLVNTFNIGEITLGQDVELLQGLLGRYLRRKMLNIEVSSKLANLEMPEAIQWLLRIYCNLYIFVKTTSNTASFLSPSVFMACPVDSTAHLREWFIDLWNSSLINLLRQACVYSVQKLIWIEKFAFSTENSFKINIEIEFITHTMKTLTYLAYLYIS